MVELVTYQELKEKYPEAAEDIERLRVSKSTAIRGVFVFGIIVGALTVYLYIAFSHTVLSCLI